MIDLSDEETLLDLLLEMRKDHALYSNAILSLSDPIMINLMNNKIDKIYIQAEALRRHLCKDNDMFPPLPSKEKNEHFPVA